MNKYDLKDKVALITGAGQGIGKAAAQAIANSGGHVILCGRTFEKLEKVAEELRPLGIKAFPLKLDVANVEEIDAAVAKCIEVFGQIDILLNCAGISELYNVVDLEPDFWDEIFDINLKGSVFMTKAVAKHMIDNNIEGSIQFVSSMAGKIGMPKDSAYSASKSAMHGFCQSAALEFAEHNINVVAICPGYINTDMMQNEFKTQAPLHNMEPAEFEQQLVDTIPMKRMADPYEVGSLMAYLSSKEASYITGVTITIAGGYINI